MRVARDGRGRVANNQYRYNLEQWEHDTCMGWVERVGRKNTLLSGRVNELSQGASDEKQLLWI